MSFGDFSVSMHMRMSLSVSSLLTFVGQVGAGLPVIAALTRFLMAGDPVYRIVGALSGVSQF